MSEAFTSLLATLAPALGLPEISVREDDPSCLLVIDDFGKEPPTDWALSQLFRVVNARYEALKPVVVTTQFSRPALIERLSKNGDEQTAVAIVSRLFEMCRKVELAGSDRRLS